MSGTADEVGAILEREWGSVTRLLADLDPTRWGTATRCAGWDVADLTRHTVWGVSMEADALRRMVAGDEDPADGVTMPEDSAPEALREGLGRAVDDLCRRVRTLTEVPADALVPMPYGQVPLPAVLDVFVFEAAIHASDFADAVGEDRPLAADVVPSVVAVLQGFLPMMASATTARLPVGCSFALEGPTVRLQGRWDDGPGLVMDGADLEPTMTVRGDDSSVLLFALGRIPADHPSLEVRGSARLAREFKQIVPGP